MRFGPRAITSEYLINQNADFISCTKEVYVSKYDLTKALKIGGKFLLNTTETTAEGLKKLCPSKMLRRIAKKGASLYVIDA